MEPAGRDSGPSSARSGSARDFSTRQRDPAYHQRMPELSEWLRLLSNEKPEVRNRAAEILVHRPDTPVSVLAWIGTYCDSTSIPNARRRLRGVRDGQVLEVLRRAAQDADSTVRGRACDALVFVASRAAIDELGRLLEDEDAAVRIQAILGLAHLNTTRSRTLLQERLRSGGERSPQVLATLEANLR